MRTFDKQAAQGDVLFIKVDSIPADASRVPYKMGGVIVAHSETGHHHSFPTHDHVQMFTTKDPFICYLKVEFDAPLEHHRSFDTHETIMFKPGNYQVRRQREHTPEGLRMIQD